MTTEMLKAVDIGMKTLGLNYAFMQWEDEIVYPYFVGEYQESPPMSEDGLQEATFILKGWTRGKWSELETAKTNIENYFNPIYGKQVTADNGTAVAIFYENSIPVPTGDAELKRIDINLSVKEWKVK